MNPIILKGYLTTVRINGVDGTAGPTVAVKNTDLTEECNGRNKRSSASAIKSRGSL